MIDRYQVISRCSVICALFNFFLAALQVFVGYVFASSALIVDGLHSLSDLLSDLFIFLAARFSSEPPDEEHQYGHKRFETMAALFSALILMLVAIAIGWSALQAIYLGNDINHFSPLILVMAFYSMLQNELLYRYINHQAQAIKSDLLHTAAIHQRADALSSFVVLLSAVAVGLGYDIFDSIGALIIAFMILRMAISILYKSANELIDAGLSPADMQSIERAVLTVDGVIGVKRVRTRIVAGDVLVELQIWMRSDVSLAEITLVRQSITTRISNLPNFNVSEVVLQVEEHGDGAEGTVKA